MKQVYGLLLAMFMLGYCTSVNPQGTSDYFSPAGTELKQNFPNPFNPSTQIEYYLPAASYVELNVYNILGIKVFTVVKAQQEAGWHKTEFTAAEIPAGLYFYELKTLSFKQSRKMLYMK